MVKLYDRATMESAKAFLEILIETVPYRIHTILTDNGIQFADLPKNRSGATAMLRGHPFDRVCRTNGIGTVLPNLITKRSSRTHESNHQRGNRQSLLLSDR